jgi:nucleoid-associated protein Lsr2
MAQKTVVIRADDIDGTEGDDVVSVSFSFDGADWEIDLGPDNKDTFQKVMADWTAHARRVSSRASGAQFKRRRRDSHAGDIRAWAAEQGITVSTHGRIPADVLAQYNATH